MHDLEEILKHAGVKGMKWGVRKASNAVKTRVKEELSSRKRERSWVKTARNIDKMDTKDIQATFQRVLLENDMKRLSKKRGISGFRNSKDRKDYRNRANFSDKELQDKVSRLRAKDNLRRQISDATKTQRILGKKLISTVGSISPKINPYVGIGQAIVDQASGKYK